MNTYTAVPRAMRVYRFELAIGGYIDIKASSYREAVLKLQSYKKLRGI